MLGLHEPDASEVFWHTGAL